MNTIEPGMISKEMLERFKQLHVENYGIYLTDEQATKDATDFLNMMRILTEPDPEEVANL